MLNAVGLDVVRVSNAAHYSLLGLRTLKIKTILDIGSNEGQFAKHMSKLFPASHIYCFEPLKEAFEKLIAFENKSNITALNIALGDSEKQVQMFSHVNHNTSSSLLNTTELCEQLFPETQKQVSSLVSMTTLDKWAQNLSKPLETEILVKLDVQGYEDRVLSGGMNTLIKAKACIIEVNAKKLYNNQANFKDLTTLLYSLGFHYAGNMQQYYDKDGFVIFFDTVFLRDKNV